VTLSRFSKPCSTPSQTAEYTGFVVAEQREKLQKEISGQHFFTIFDGTTRLGEAFVIVVRWVTTDFAIQQRLLSF